MVAFTSVVGSTGKENVPLLEVVVVLLELFCEESSTYSTIIHCVTQASSKEGYAACCKKELFAALRRSVEQKARLERTQTYTTWQNRKFKQE